MTTQDAATLHTYSMRLVRPFLKLLHKRSDFPHELLRDLEVMDADERLPVATMIELLRGAIEITGDQDLGLKAAREIGIGDYGALEYAAGSAATARDALDVIMRFAHLINDALHVTMHIEGDKAYLRLESAVMLTRAAADFQSGAFHVAIKQHDALRDAPPTDVWFTHGQPKDAGEYALTFSGEIVSFDKPWNGFVIDAKLLDAPLRTADQKLHAVVRRHAEVLLAELPKAQSFTESVRAILTKELAAGDPSAAHVSKALHMSARTLARRLEDEGTTFKELVEDLRRRLALRYIGGQDLDISEVALLLGFSDSSSFYRAFKRWTNQTPLAYRKTHRN